MPQDPPSPRGSYSSSGEYDKASSASRQNTSYPPSTSSSSSSSSSYHSSKSHSRATARHYADSGDVYDRGSRSYTTDRDDTDRRDSSRTNSNRYDDRSYHTSSRPSDMHRYDTYRSDNDNRDGARPGSSHMRTYRHTDAHRPIDTSRYSSDTYTRSTSASSRPSDSYNRSIDTHASISSRGASDSRDSEAYSRATPRTDTSNTSNTTSASGVTTPRADAHITAVSRNDTQTSTTTHSDDADITSFRAATRRQGAGTQRVSAFSLSMKPEDLYGSDSIRRDPTTATAAGADAGAARSGRRDTSRTDTYRGDSGRGDAYERDSGRGDAYRADSGRNDDTRNNDTRNYDRRDGGRNDGGYGGIGRYDSGRGDSGRSYQGGTGYQRDGTGRGREDRVDKREFARPRNPWAKNSGSVKQESYPNASSQSDSERTQVRKNNPWGKPSGGQEILQGRYSSASSSAAPMKSEYSSKSLKEDYSGDDVDSGQGDSGYKGMGSYYASEESQVASSGADGENAVFGGASSKRLEMIRKQRQKDVENWESEKLRHATSGFRDIDVSEIERNDEHKDHMNIVALDTTPRFLKGYDIVMKESESANIIRDKNGDFARMCREGSDTLRQYKENKDKNTNKENFWDAAGNKIGDVIGLKKEGTSESEPGKDLSGGEGNSEEVDFRTAFARKKKDSVEPPTKEEMVGDFSTERSSKPRTMREVRESLPVFTVRDELMNIIQENQVVVVVGETGSGKTTQLTQYLLEDGWAKHGMIACTQPRRVAAVSVATRVCEEIRGDMSERDIAKEMELYKAGKHKWNSQDVFSEDMDNSSSSGLGRGRDDRYDNRNAPSESGKSGKVDEKSLNLYDLGGVVGYAIRFEDCSSSMTRIKYMTDGILLRECLGNNTLGKYSVIILDEAHERSLNTDTLLGLLKQLCQKRSDIRIIVTSATMDAQRFSDFFGSAPIFHIPGRTFPVEIVWSRSAKSDYVRHVVDTVVKIHISQPKGDILCFMTGQDDVEAVCALVPERLEEVGNNNSNIPGISMLPIYSQLSSEQQARVFMPSPLRKCVVATNVAETSLTVDGVKYVVDTGLCKIKVYSPKIGMDALQVAPIAQANANQRSGRAGRTGPGVCYRLYTDRMFAHEMLKMPVPELQRSHLANVVLLLLGAGVDNPLDFDFIDRPSSASVLAAMYQLWCLGALDDSGKLTEVGKAMSSFPLSPPLSRTLVEAGRRGCLTEVVTVVALASVPSVLFTPPDRREQASTMHEKLQVADSDHLTLLHIYREWQRHGYSSKWATGHFLHPKSLVKAKEIRMQLLDICKAQHMQISTCHHDVERVRLCICAGYIVNVAKGKGMHTYSHVRTGQEVHLHPTSAVCIGAGGYVVYEEVVMTTKEYMHNVSVVDPAWLLELAPRLYSTREKRKRTETEKFLEDYIHEYDEKEKKEKEEEERQKKQMTWEETAIGIGMGSSDTGVYGGVLKKRRFGGGL